MSSKKSKENDRISWDDYFVELTDFVSRRATCDRKHVGAVLVKDNRIIATGYNGSIPGEPHCSDPEKYFEEDLSVIKPDLRHYPAERYSVAEWQSMQQNRTIGMSYFPPVVEKHGGHDIENDHCIRTVHAEVNVIAQAARLGIATEGTTLYCNTQPCWDCFKVIVSAGVKEIVYKDKYKSNPRVEECAARQKIKLRQHSI